VLKLSPQIQDDEPKSAQEHDKIIRMKCLEYPTTKPSSTNNPGILVDFPQSRHSFSSR
jgi:hypothetical protein